MLKLWAETYQGKVTSYSTTLRHMEINNCFVVVNSTKRSMESPMTQKENQPNIICLDHYCTSTWCSCSSLRILTFVPQLLSKWGSVLWGLEGSLCNLQSSMVILCMLCLCCACLCACRTLLEIPTGGGTQTTTFGILTIFLRGCTSAANN